MKRSLAVGAVLLQTLTAPRAWADPSGVPRFMREQAALLNGGKPVQDAPFGESSRPQTARLSEKKASGEKPVLPPEFEKKRFLKIGRAREKHGVVSRLPESLESWTPNWIKDIFDEGAANGAIVGVDPESPEGYALHMPRTPLEKIEVFKAKKLSGRVTNDLIIHINGVKNDVEQQARSLRLIAEKTGARVIGIHNGSYGIVMDLGQCFTDKFGEGLQALSGERWMISWDQAVTSLGEVLYDELRNGRRPHIMAHSHGGIVAARGLRRAVSLLRERDGYSAERAEEALEAVEVETFGAASWRYPDGPQYVHYINEKDPIPNVFGLRWDFIEGSPIAWRGKRAVIVRFKEGESVFSFEPHSFDGVYLPRRGIFEHIRATVPPSISRRSY